MTQNENLSESWSCPKCSGALGRDTKERFRMVYLQFSRSLTAPPTAHGKAGSVHFIPGCSVESTIPDHHSEPLGKYTPSILTIFPSFKSLPTTTTSDLQFTPI